MPSSIWLYSCISRERFNPYCMHPKIAICLSDLHVGSTTGLLGPDFKTHEGYHVRQNEVQQWMWKCWQDCWKWARHIIGDDSWLAVVNGDLIDGNHHNTREIWSPDNNDHSSACVEILKHALTGSDSVYITEGTNVHTQNSEHGIASALKSEGIHVKKPEGKLTAWPELRLSIANTNCEFNHHMGVSMRSYLESSQFSITLGDIRNQRAREGGKIPKVIVRSHRHRFGLYEDGYGMIVALPSWQASTRFTQRVAPAIVPQCGLVLLDWRDTEGDCTPVIQKRLHICKNPTSNIV
jgi:hypothetical protein